MITYLLIFQEQSSPAVVYWPSELGSSTEFVTMIISNNSNSVDSKNKNIHIRELELSIEDSDYVRFLNIFEILSKVLDLDSLYDAIIFFIKLFKSKERLISLASRNDWYPLHLLDLPFIVLLFFRNQNR